MLASGLTMVSCGFASKEGGPARRPTGLSAAGVVCEAMNGDETMARFPDLEPFAARHGLKVVSIFGSSTTVLGTGEYVRCAVEASSPRPERTRPWRTRKTGGFGEAPV